jgi:hypothetical protein
VKLPRDLSGEQLIAALRVGPLAAILGDVADHFETTREKVAKRLFGG